MCTNYPDVGSSPSYVEYDVIVEYLTQNINGNMESFMRDFGIKYYKSIIDKEYVVINSDEGIVTVWYYDNKLCDFKYGKISEEKSEGFKNRINVGSSLSSVIDSDPLGNYEFMYISWTESPEISYHFFSDGVGLEIKYNNAIVTEILEFTI